MTPRSIRTTLHAAIAAIKGTPDDKELRLSVVLKVFLEWAEHEEVHFDRVLESARLLLAHEKAVAETLKEGDRS